MSRRRSPGRATKAGGQDPPSEDDALWEHTASTVEPLRKAKARVPDVAASTSSPPKHRGTVSAPEPSQVSIDPVTPAAAPRAPRKSEPPPLAQFERRHARRVAGGRTDIDARLDLHGLRQDDAHRRLTGFLTSCAAQGMSVVLVITGKGGPPAGDADRVVTVMDRPERGILRRMLPLWIAEPALRGVVVSFTAASIRHGGEGAFYIRLRRRR